MKKKNAFTLGEILVTLAILGILAAISLPIITSVRPNEEMAMLKKAYHNTARVVSELINDEDLYPDRDGADCPEAYAAPEGGSAVCDGFANTSIKDMLDGVHEAEYNGQIYEGETKFCELFAAKMNVNNKGTACADFTTSDGMRWHVPATGFNGEAAGFNGEADPIIYVDVTGTSKGKNCAIDILGEAVTTCPGFNTPPDTFGFRVGRHGELRVIGTLAPQYIASDKPSMPYSKFDVDCVGLLCKEKFGEIAPGEPIDKPLKD